MKFHTVLVVTGLSAWGWTVAAAPEPISDSSVKASQNSTADWVKDLSDDQFRIREFATKKIWEIGDAALSDLQTAVQTGDPETAYRARELVRKIELHLTPDTDPEVMKLVERYSKASTDDKQALLEQMERKRAWRQILKLFANEKNPELLKRVQSSMVVVAVRAARESLINGDSDGAREYLEMAPADSSGLMALADFHRSQGTLEAELKRAKTLKGVNSNAWQLALYLASGNVEAARDAANAAGETRISAAMSVLLGDPIPWMLGNLTNADGSEIHKPYTELAVKRWRGKKLLASDLEPLVKALASSSPKTRAAAINSLFLLGEPGLAEPAYIKIAPSVGFGYFDLLERIPEALKSFGLDPENPNYSEWVEKRVARMVDEDGEEARPSSAATTDLILMAGFMDRRGMSEQFDAAFMKPMLKFAEKNEKTFTEFLGVMLGNRRRFSGAPDMGKRIGYEWAAEDGGRWDDLLSAVFGEDEEITKVWDWLADLDPEASRIDRFDALLALSGMGTDPLSLREKWLSMAWKAVDAKPENERKALLENLYLAASLSPDVSNTLKLWDRYPEKDRDELFTNSCISELTIGGRWDEAAKFFLDQIERIAKFKLDPSPAIHASAAACLRKAGKNEQAAVQDEWVEKLALGRDAYNIAIGYQIGDDYARAQEWFSRAVKQENPGPNGEYAAALEEYGVNLLENGKWKDAAAVFEVKAHMDASLSADLLGPSEKLKLRLQSDLGRALANLKTDRAASLALLGHVYQMFPGDGTLADFFFPSIRKMGLIKEHDAWFKTSWDRMNQVAKEFPGSSNTLNTTGWLAARATRNLDQAEELLDRALALKPDESSYLDTMAEIQFCKGRREKALEWSSKALNFTPGDAGITGLESFMLRHQHERFRADPIPE